MSGDELYNVWDADTGNCLKLNATRAETATLIEQTRVLDPERTLAAVNECETALQAAWLTIQRVPA